MVNVPGSRDHVLTAAVPPGGAPSEHPDPRLTPWNARGKADASLSGSLPLPKEEGAL